MFVIVDTQTGEWLRQVPNVGFNIVSGYTTVPAGKAGARIFKRKGDLSSHVSNNVDFYRHHGNRFVAQEMELVPMDQTPMSDLLDAKKKRDVVKQAEIKRRQAEFKQAQVVRLQAEIERLKAS